MKYVSQSLLPLMVVALVSGCAKPHKQNVWDMYDVRHPVPKDSQVPVSQATQYDQYIDNDEYYIPPGAYQTDPD